MTGFTGATGTTGTTGPTGPAALAPGGCYSDYLYWDTGLVAWTNGQNEVHIGCLAAATTIQGTQAVAVGYNSGNNAQQAFAVAVGSESGVSNQQSAAVAVGYLSGNIDQQRRAIAIGNEAGQNRQFDTAIAIGFKAGFGRQQISSIAIGAQAGETDQGSAGVVTGDAIAIGTQAGQGPSVPQAGQAIAMGFFAGNDIQNSYCIAIGSSAGAQRQGGIANLSGQEESAIAIGFEAGSGFSNPQGTFSIAIGFMAERTNGNSTYESIVINATNIGYDSQNSDATHISPIRLDSNDYHLVYNPRFDGATLQFPPWAPGLSIKGSAEITMGCAGFLLASHILPLSRVNPGGAAFWTPYSAEAANVKCPGTIIRTCERNSYQFDIVICDPDIDKVYHIGKAINAGFSCEYTGLPSVRSCWGIYAVVRGIAPQPTPNQQYAFTPAVQLTLHWGEDDSPATTQMQWVGTAAWLEDRRSDATVVFPSLVPPDGPFDSRDRVLLIQSNQTV